jgi:Ca2+-binding RTX toxin-like protein
MPNFNGTINADSIKGSLIADLIQSFEGNDTIKSGNGNDTIYAGSGDDFIDAGNDQDWIYAGSGKDTVKAGAGHDFIYGGADADSIDAGSGNDTIYGDSDGSSTLPGSGDDTIDTSSGDDLAFGEGGNDYIIGDSGNDTIYGGADNGTLASEGTPAVPDKISFTYEGLVSVAFHNTVGYYIKDGLGNPTVGKIVTADAFGLAAGTTFDVNVADASSVGFFIIPNGGVQNTIANGDDVSFVFDGGIWKAFKGATELVGSATEVTLGDTSPYFDNPALNPDGFNHVQDNANAGNLNWEDLFNGGDLDFNDVNLTVEITIGTPGTPGTEFHAGDTIDLDSGNDLVVYNKGVDGVDLITDFMYNGIDTLKLVGAVAGTTNIDQIGDDVLVTFDDAGGGIKLLDTTVDLVTAHTIYA